MKIVIAGAGEVGSHLAKLLSEEGQDIILVDEDEGKLDDFEMYNLLTCTGRPTSFSTLREAGAKGCDLFIAVTPFESRNLMACAIAKKFGAHNTVARIDNYEYMKEDKPISSSMIRKALEHKDNLITQVLSEASEYLSNGIATVINFYNPELIVLGGGLIEAIDGFYQNTIEKAKIKALPIPAKKTQFKKAQLGDFSGVIGACFLEDLQKNKTPDVSGVLR